MNFLITFLDYLQFSSFINLRVINNELNFKKPMKNFNLIAFLLIFYY